MKAYPIELRERVVAAYASGHYSLAEVAELFNVGLSFVKRMWHLSQHGLSLAPRHGGGVNPTLTAADLSQLQTAVAAQPDRTLAEWQSWLRRKRHRAVSLATICRALQKLNLPLKKKPDCA